MPDQVLTLSNVVVAFGALLAVNNVSLSVARGERRAIIGPNGAGKTTLFHAVTGVVAPTSGMIHFEGRDITNTPPHRRARLGIARTFQITNLFPLLTVEENLVLSVRGLTRRKFSLFGTPQLDSEEAQRVTDVLNLSRLSDRRSVTVKELSYGEQRQLEMAMALATNPRLLFLDEPAAGLSPAERSIVADIIRSLPPQLTVVLIEHDMDLALALVDYVTCMYEGKVLVEAAPDAIRTNDAVQEVYLGKPRHA
ncbi:MAG TPA: ABC transporter ATP-binding protein [Xanthobacteraceae bacterium]|nr:ABC transporter ATP-binding protein [Xanthobacteraceae bacterium]